MAAPGDERPPSHRERLWNRLVAWLGLLAPLVLTAALAHHTLVDLDIWLHDRVGSDILAGEGLPSRNTYSFTAPEHPWIDHEWLFQVLVAAVAPEDPEDAARAWHLLRLALGVALLGVAMIGGRGGREDAGSRWPGVRCALVAPAAVASLLLLWPRLVLRPELISYLLFILLVREIEAATRRGMPAGGPALRLLDPRHHPLGRTVLLTWIWAQFHGFHVLAPGLWLVALVLQPLERRRRPTAGDADGPPRAGLSPAAWLLAIVACLAVGALTPSGLRGLLHPLRVLGQFGAGGPDLRGLIAEMAPLPSTGEALGWTVLAFHLSIVWGGLWILVTAGRVGTLRIAAWGFALAAALVSQRNLGFYALSFLLLHTGHDPSRRWLWRRWTGSLPATHVRGSTWRPLLATLPAILAAAAAAVWIAALVDSTFYLHEGVPRRWGAGLAAAHYPFRIAERGRALCGPDARLFNNIDAASTLIRARVGRVFVDGRTEAYPPAVWRAYAAAAAGGSVALDLLASREVDGVVLAHRSTSSHRLVTTLLASPAWRLAALDDAGILFVASGSGQAAPASPALLWREAAERLLAAHPAPAARGRGRDVTAADRFLALAALERLGGQDAEAERLLTRGLELAPRHPLLNHNYGNLLMQRGSYRRALDHFERALALLPGALEPRTNAGVCELQLGNLERAEAIFTDLVRRRPAWGPAWVNLAETRRRRGDRQGALAAYDRALRLLPDDARLRAHVEAYRGGDPAPPPSR